MNEYFDIFSIISKQVKDISLYFKLKKSFIIADDSIYYLGNKNHIKEELEKLKVICDLILKKCPKGDLIISGNDKKSFFYYSVKEGSSYQFRKYLSKRNDINLIIWLSNKRYYKRLSELIKEELENINTPHFDVWKKYNLYDELNPKIRKYVVPLLCSRQFAIDCWNGSKWLKNEYKNENLIFGTNRGEMVRSKSEKIIADLLFANKNIEYKYECAIILEENGYPVFPDYIVLNYTTGRIYIWEHIGMMDNPDYANDFVKKYNRYIGAGFILGIDLFFTIESQMHKYNSNSTWEIYNIIAG